MRIGVPKEIKNHEYRVGLTPSAVQEYTKNGHEVLVQADAGKEIGFYDDQYEVAGATMIADASEIFDRAEMIVKVKEPQPNECKMLSPGQILFTYLHLAPDHKQTKLLCESGATCIAYETVTAPDGTLPLLAPMSEVAGRMSIQAGAHHLEKSAGGRGVLLGGVPGVPPAKVLVIGGGIVGENAAAMAVGMGADVTILDKSISRLRELDQNFEGRAKMIYSTSSAIEEHALESDLIIGAVLVPGATAPKLLSADIIQRMKRGSVIVDVAIDQGGCFQTSRPTTHDEPIYLVDEVIHYCVANMPGAVARTSTMALNNATLPYGLTLANNGVSVALLSDPHLRSGLNICNGKITCAAVADAQELDFTEPLSALG